MIFDLHSDLLFDVVSKRKQGFTHVIRDFHLHKLKDCLGIVATMYFEGNNSYNQLLESLHYIHEEVIENKENFNFIFKYDDIDLSNGKINILLAIEGLSPLQSLSDIYMIYNCGIRQISLTWNDKNRLASGANYYLENSGLTELGQEVIKLCQQLGILIDVSHLNLKSFYDVLALSNKPIIASHSDCYSLSKHQRNLDDSQIKLIAKSGGVIGICPAFFVGENKEDRTLKKLVEHYLYIKNLVGSNHIAIGNDFMDFLPDYQNNSMVKELNSSKDVFKIMLNLKDNFNQDELENIYYKNYLRVLSLVLK